MNAFSYLLLCIIGAFLGINFGPVIALLGSLGLAIILYSINKNKKN